MGAICGFSGERDEKLLAAMVRALSHRGDEPPDVHSCSWGTVAYFPRGGTVQRKKLGIGLHIQGDDLIAVSGNLTDEDVVQKGLLGLLATIRDEGVRSLERVSGDFVAVVHLASTPAAGSTWHVIRDGLGARTIYHAHHGGRFFFASEPKGIWSVPGFPRRVRAASIAQYLAFSFVPGEDMMLEGLYELPAGHSLTKYGNSPVTLRRYFCFEQHEHDADSRHDQSTSDSSDLWDSPLRHCLSEGIRQRPPRDESPAVFLSGGLDSSVVTAELARQSQRPVHSYALHFGKKYPNELEFARAVADCCGTRHYEVEIRPRQFLPRLRRMVWHLDDPIGDPIAMPNMELARHVSQDHRWVFNGEGDDPCFGGPKNIPMMLGHFWFQGELRRYARSILSPRAVRRAAVFDPAVVKNLLAYNLETRNGRYGLRLWMLLTFEIWRRIVVAGETI
jgi:asparagine synthase (glutamine-hydrolysing)